MTEKTYEDGIAEERDRIAFLIDEQWDKCKAIPYDKRGWYIQALADLRRLIGEGAEKTAMSPYLKALYEIDERIPFPVDDLRELIDEDAWVWREDSLRECIAILKRVMPEGCPDDLFPKDKLEK